MKKTSYFYLIFFLFLWSCQLQENRPMTACGVHINYDAVQNGDFELNDVTYIPLETNDRSLLGDINKVLFKNGKIYVLDKNGNSGVYIFDQAGHFLSAINKQGEAPDEYIELMDMDVDHEGNVYIADNARMNLMKYDPTHSKLQETIHVGKHFFEFAWLKENSFLLRDVFGPDGLEMKLAHFDATSQSLVPLIKKNTTSVNEMSIMKCSKHYLYRSNDQIYYNNRFTPYIYSLSEEGKIIPAYTISSDSYIQEDELKNLENNPMKFIQETTYIKDIISLYENDQYFICSPFINPSADYLLIPKKSPDTTRKINLMYKKEFTGASPIVGVCNNQFVVLLNPTNIPEEIRNNNPILNTLGEDANFVLMLFTIQ